jgi:PPOX class probable F420-dependent enzyme
VSESAESPSGELPAGVRALVEKANFAHVATTNADGAPAVAAVWVTLIDGRAAFFTSPATNHGRNLARDPRVALSIIDFDNPYSLARIRGRVDRRIEGDDAVAIIHEMAHKYLSTRYPRPVPANAFVTIVAHDRAVREDYSDVHRPAASGGGA